MATESRAAGRSLLGEHGEAGTVGPGSMRLRGLSRNGVPDRTRRFVLAIDVAGLAWTGVRRGDVSRESRTAGAGEGSRSTPSKPQAQADGEVLRQRSGHSCSPFSWIHRQGFRQARCRCSVASSNEEKLKLGPDRNAHSSAHRSNCTAWAGVRRSVIVRGAAGMGMGRNATGVAHKDRTNHVGFLEGSALDLSCWGPCTRPPHSLDARGSPVV
jgi:hypothetical protein